MFLLLPGVSGYSVDELQVHPLVVQSKSLAGYGSPCIIQGQESFLGCRLFWFRNRPCSICATAFLRGSAKSVVLQLHTEREKIMNILGTKMVLKSYHIKQLDSSPAVVESISREVPLQPNKSCPHPPQPFRLTKVLTQGKSTRQVSDFAGSDQSNTLFFSSFHGLRNSCLLENRAVDGRGQELSSALTISL